MLKSINTIGLYLHKIYLNIAILAFFTGYFSTFALASQDCLELSQVKLALSEITLFTEAPATKSWRPINPLNSSEFDLCEKDHIVYKIVSALISMQKMDQLPIPSLDIATSNNHLFKEGTLKYFKKRVKKIYFEESNESICNIALAYVFPEELDTVHVCAKKKDKFTSDIYTSSILIHEARHIDGLEHTLCKHRRSIKRDYMEKIPLSGTCDSDFRSQGSYGIQVTYLLNLYSRSEHKVEKQIAKSQAIAELLSRFNTLPLDIKNGKLVINKNGSVTFVEQNENLKLPQTKTTLFQLGPTVKSATLFLFNPAFFDETGAVTSYNYSQNLETVDDPVANYYRRNLSKDDYQKIRDIFFQKNWNEYGCFLFTSHLLCMSSLTKNPVYIPLNKIQPQGFTILENFASKYDLVYLKDLQGNQYRLPQSFKVLQKTTEESLLYQFKRASQKNKNPFLNSDSGILLNEMLLESHLPNLLSANNNRFFTDDDKSKISPSPYSIIKETTASEWIVSPFYWSKKLEEL